MVVTGNADGLRERTRRAVRAELSRVAVELFSTRGYDGTTVDEIAKAAGLSKRSFFRYFPSKEDAVLADMDILGEQVTGQIASRPAGEKPWDSLHMVLGDWAQRIDDATAATERLRLIEETPALRARWQAKREDLRQAVSAALREREGVVMTEFEADLLTAAAAAALDAVSRQWRRDGSRGDRGALIDQAFALLRPASL